MEKGWAGGLVQVGFGPFVSTAFFVAVAAEIVVRLFVFY